MPRTARRGTVPGMLVERPSPADIVGLPGWSWRPLGPADLALAWPLAWLAGAAADLAAWRALAGGWIAAAAKEGGGLGALANRDGVLVALAHHRLERHEGLKVMRVPWLHALEVTAAPRCLEALVETLLRLGRRAGCAVVELVGDEASRERLGAVATRLELVQRGGCWIRELASGGEVVPLHPVPDGTALRRVVG